MGQAFIQVSKIVFNACYHGVIIQLEMESCEKKSGMLRPYLNGRHGYRNPKSNSLMFCIDRLLHGFNWSVKYGSTRPVAVNLIEGRLQDVILFLDELSYGPCSMPGTVEQKTEWYQKSQNARGWALRKNHME